MVEAYNDAPTVAYPEGITNQIQMAARQNAYKTVSCRLRYVYCSKILSEQICSKTSGAFYLWARKTAESIMNSGGIRCF